MDTAQPSELACLPQEPRVTMRHKISYSYKTMFANCRIPNGHWKTLYTLLQQQNSLQALSTSKIAEPHARLAVAKESAHPCRSSSQYNRTCSYRPTAAAHATEDLNTADTSCPSRTSAEHFDNRPGPCAEHSFELTTPAEGTPRLQACINAAELAIIANELAIIANSIALDTV